MNIVNANKKSTWKFGNSDYLEGAPGYCPDPTTHFKSHP